MMVLQELLKVISLCLETHVSMLHVHEYCSQCDKRNLTIFLVIFIVKVSNNAVFVFRHVRQIVKSDY